MLRPDTRGLPDYTKNWRWSSRVRGIATIMGVVSFALMPLSPGDSVGASSAERMPTTDPLEVVNGEFDRGSAGWRTNHPDRQTLMPTEGRNGNGIKLTNRRGGVVILNDAESTVRNAPVGRSYTASAWVHTSSPNVSGALRIREVSSDRVKSHYQHFWLTDSGWHKVQLNMTTSLPHSSFDLNVLGYHIHSGGSLDVDDVSLARSTDALADADTSFGETSAADQAAVPEDAASTEANNKAVGSLTNGGTHTKLGIPSKGAYFGASVGGRTNLSDFENNVGSTLGLHRSFYGAGEIDEAVDMARSDLAHNRVPWISFKMPYSWSEMAAGNGDAWVKSLTNQLNQLNGPIWLAFHHEPEGDGNISNWTAMQKHLSPIVHANSDNVAYSVIVTGWNQFYGPDQYSLGKIWPGDDVVDIVGFDIYNSYGISKNGQTLDATNMNAYFEKIQNFTAKHDVEWGLAETGFNDQAAQKNPQWLQNTFDDLVDHGGIGMAYFNTNLNSVTSWVISTDYKTSLFTSVLDGSTRLE